MQYRVHLGIKGDTRSSNYVYIYELVLVTKLLLICVMLNEINTRRSRVCID